MGNERSRLTQIGEWMNQTLKEGSIDVKRVIECMLMDQFNEEKSGGKGEKVNVLVKIQKQRVQTIQCSMNERNK